MESLPESSGTKKKLQDDIHQCFFLLVTFGDVSGCSDLTDNKGTRVFRSHGWCFGIVLGLRKRMLLLSSLLFSPGPGGGQYRTLVGAIAMGVVGSISSSKEAWEFGEKLSKWR